MDEWFTVDKIDHDTFVISEYKHPEETHCYLLCGEELCLLIDTGLGVCDISEVVGRLAGKPVIAAATHIHWDHIGGYGRFGSICAHSAEVGWLDSGFPLAVGAVRKMLAEGDLPNGFAINDYTIFQGTPVENFSGRRQYRAWRKNAHGFTYARTFSGAYVFLGRETRIPVYGRPYI